MNYPNGNHEKTEGKTQSIVFGIVPSRRLGHSLGISPIPRKSCNYSCVYCQLGRTTKYIRERQEFFPLEDILRELRTYLDSIQPEDYDVITIVGDGDPSLYSRLEELVANIKQMQEKPVAIISNGALLPDLDVYNAFLKFDIVMLNFDSWNEKSHKEINRPLKNLTYKDKLNALRKFSQHFQGILYLEVMLVNELNDSREAIQKIAEKLEGIKFQRIFVNTPVRPPAEDWVKIPDKKSVKYAKKIFHAKSIDYLPKAEFNSIEKDPFQAIMNIISRHPMNDQDITKFLEEKYALIKNNKKKSNKIGKILKRLRRQDNVVVIEYGNRIFFRRE